MLPKFARSFHHGPHSQPQIVYLATTKSAFVGACVGCFTGCIAGGLWFSVVGQSKSPATVPVEQEKPLATKPVEASSSASSETECVDKKLLADLEKRSRALKFWKRMVKILVDPSEDYQVHRDEQLLNAFHNDVSAHAAHEHWPIPKVEDVKSAVDMAQADLRVLSESKGVYCKKQASQGDHLIEESEHSYPLIDG